MTPLLRPFFTGGQITLTVDSAMKNESEVANEDTTRFDSATRRGQSLLEFALVHAAHPACWCSAWSR